MSTITREQLRARAREKVKSLEFSITQTAFADSRAELEEELELARIALASLEAEPVAWLLSGGGAKNNVSFDSGNAYADPLREVTPLYTAPPAPVSVPDEDLLHMAASAIEDLLSNKDRSGAGVWADVPAKLRRAAMLQGADGALTNEGTIPVTQFKPVADLYGLTSPTGGETSFTFDAVEARDFIDGGWSCQEYVELGRFQEAMLQNGNSPAQSDCCPAQNYIAPAQDGNSPVIPDCWVACSERMPEDEQEVIVQNKMGYRYVSYFDEHSGLFFDMRGGNQMNCIEHIFVTHWMPLPAAPQQK